MSITNLNKRLDKIEQVVRDQELDNQVEVTHWYQTIARVFGRDYDGEKVFAPAGLVAQAKRFLEVVYGNIKQPK